MKKIIVLVVLCVLMTFVFSCKRDEIHTMSLGTISVVNAVINGDVVKINTNIRDSALNLNSKNFQVSSGENWLRVYPVGDSLHPYFNWHKEVVNGGVYSLYLFGKKLKGIDTMWVKENYLPYYTDSAMGIRIVNLVADSEPLFITLASDTLTSLFSNIGYKDISDFVKIPLKTNVSEESVTFQLRNTSKDIIASYTIPNDAISDYENISILLSRYKCITLVLKGEALGGSGNAAIGLYPVANY